MAFEAAVAQLPKASPVFLTRTTDYLRTGGVSPMSAVTFGHVLGVRPAGCNRAVGDDIKVLRGGDGLVVRPLLDNPFNVNDVIDPDGVYNLTRLCAAATSWRRKVFV